MTERRPAARPPAWPVMAGAAGAFLATMAFLAAEVRDGRDPALGPAPAARRDVVVRRVVRRVVITHRAPRPRRAAPADPAPAVPAPAPAAPDPDPVTTQAS